MKKLLNKLNIFKRLNALESSIKHFRLVEKNNYEAQESLRSTIRILENKIEMQRKTLKALDISVGVDVHQRTNSWAVICIGGKQEYVKFIEIENTKDAQVVLKFIKQFERNRMVIDASPSFKQFIGRTNRKIY